jgi:hypothetical protein
MLHAIQRNVVLIVGIALTGFVCVLAAPYLISDRGDAGPTIMQASSWIVALLAIVVCFAFAVAIAGVAGRLSNGAVGLFILGAGLFVLDGRLETVRAFAFANAEVNPPWPLAILFFEALLWTALTLAAAVTVFRIAGPLDDIEPKQFTPLGIGLFHNGRTAHHRPFFSAKNLDAYRSFVRIDVELLHALVGIANQAVGRNKFGVEHVRTVLLAQMAKRRVAHVFHRRQKQREIR